MKTIDAPTVTDVKESVALRVVIVLLTMAFVSIAFIGWHLVSNYGSLIKCGAATLYVSLALSFALLGNIAGAIRSKS